MTLTLGRIALVFLVIIVVATLFTGGRIHTVQIANLQDKVDGLESAGFDEVASCDIERYQRLYANALSVLWQSSVEADREIINHEQFIEVNQTAIGFDPALRALFDESSTGRANPGEYGAALNATYFKAMSGECGVEGVSA